MFYRVLFHDKDSKTRWGTGVFAETEKAAREVAAIILTLAHNVLVSAESLTVVEIKGMESDEPTTT